MVLRAFFDIGASFTVMKKDVAEKVGYILPADVKEVTLADGETKIKVLGYIPISMMLEGLTHRRHSLRYRELAEELIVGVKVMGFYGIKLNPSTNKLVVGKNYSSFELYAYGQHAVNSSSKNN